LIDAGLERGVSITLFTDDAIPAVPPQVEVNPEFRDALSWADFVAIDLLMEDLSILRSLLGINDLDNIPLDSQILLTTTMPCGFGTCGACSVRGQHSWILACKEGPVFDLSDLAW
jgi:succinate dehydrogenase/fumarate reductase-like Fe-S protein